MAVKSVRKLIQLIAFWVAILVLFLPLYFQYVLAIYKVEIQLPRDHTQLVQDVQVVTGTLDRFLDDNGHYPPELSFLVPTYLKVLPDTFEDFTYEYERSDSQEFGLKIYVPPDWLGWPAIYACADDGRNDPFCSYQYLCLTGRSEMSSKATEDTPKDRTILDYINDKHPCSS